MICRKCHKTKKKAVWVRHEKQCIPTKEDMQRYLSCKPKSLIGKEGVKE